MGLGDALGALTDSAKDAYHDFVPDPVEDKVEGVVQTGGEVLNSGANFAADQMDRAGWKTGADLTRGGADAITNQTGGDVNERELGETREANKLVHGSPSKLQSTADHLDGFRKAFDRVGRGMKGLDSHHLKGKTADAFRESVEVQPGRWFKAADACEKAGKALESFSRTVRWAQGEAADAVVLFDRGKAASARYKSNVTFYNDALEAYKEIPEKDRVSGSLPDRPPTEDPGAAQMTEAREKLTEARRQRDEAARAANKRMEAARDAAPPKPSYAAQARSGLKGGLLAVEHRIGGFMDAGSGLLNFSKGMSPITPHNVLNPDEYQTNLNSTAAGMKAVAMDPTGAAKAAYHSFLKDPDAFFGGMALDALTGGAGKAASAASRASRAAARHADDAPAVPPRPEHPPKPGHEPDRPGREALNDEPDGPSRREDDKEVGEDPVDFATGRMLLPQTDLVLPGVLPLVFRRQFESSYRAGRWFGPTWSSTVDQRLEIDAEGVVLHGENSLLVSYPRPEPGGVPVLPAKGPRRPLARTDEGDYVLTDPDTGETWHFNAPDAPDSPAAREGVALLEEMSDRNGNRITFEYDENGVPLALVHSGGYHVHVEADPEAGRVTALRLADAARDGGVQEIVRFGYDTHGNLTEVTGSSGLPLRFGYDEAGRVTSWTDTNDSRYEYAYDVSDRCVWQSGVDGHMAATFTYSPVDPATGHRVTKVTNSLGHVTRYLVNDRNQVAAVTDPTGATTRTTRDARHRVLAHSDALGRTTRLERDTEGRVVRVLRPDGTSVTCAYDDAGLPSRYTGPDGSVWEHTHDERGNRLRSTDPAGAVTSYAYDDSGRLTSVTDALGHVTRVRCDAAGLPIAITGPPPVPGPGGPGGDGSSPSAVATYHRDAFGRPTTVTNPLGDTTTLTWTVEGKPVTRTGPDGSTERWEWDGEGNCTRHVDAAGGETTYEYTHFDLLSARTGPDGVRYAFTHDTRLRLTKVTNPQGLTWTYDYDAADRLVAETDFDGRHHSYEVDPAGQLRCHTSPLGETTAYERDVLGRTARKDAAGAVTTYAYDPAGRLTHAHGPDAELLRQYDRAGRLKTEVVNGRTLTHTYDALGRPTRRTTPTGAVSTYTYDAAGNRTSVTTDGHTLTSSHDAAGRESQRDIDETASLSWTWDPAGRLTGQALNGRAPEADWQRAYTYSPDGHLLAMDDSREGTSRYTLDTAGRVTAVNARDWTESYAYDETGNQTSAHWPTDHPGADAQGPRTYTGTRIRTAGRLRYEHDAAGRVTTRQKKHLSRRPETWRYTWDAEDHLVQVTTPDGAVWHYAYDPLGRRISKHSATERVDFTWDGPTLIEQTTTGPTPHPVTLTWNHRGLHPISQTERLTDETTQREYDTRFFAIVTDLIGTPTALVTEDGTTAWHTQRTLWGTTTWNTDATTYTPLRFPGQYFDPETTLHYNHHRHYDPETARYLSPDPLGLTPAPNPVAYVDNPHTWTDPLGLFGCPKDERGPFQFRAPNPEYPPLNSASEALSSVPFGGNIDCSEVAENILRASDGKGHIVNYTTPSGAAIGIPSNMGGEITRYRYHDVFTDGRYVYEPEMSQSPIPMGDYERALRHVNEGEKVFRRKGGYDGPLW